jgi:hypothetical protein
MSTFRPNPFVITFDDGADGGPDHFVWLLKEYRVQLWKEGECVAEGTVAESEDDTITLLRPDDERFFPRWPLCEERWAFNLYDGSFDEIRYL